MITLSFETSSISDNKIVINNHGLENCTPVKYDNGSVTVPYDIGLIDGTIYYSIKFNDNQIYLAQSINDINFFLGEFSDLINVETNVVYLEDHGFSTGERIVYSAQEGTAIGGLSSGSIYYIIRVDDNNIKLSTTLSAATSGIPIDITDLGIGYSHLIAKFVDITQGSEPPQTHNLLYDFYLDELIETAIPPAGSINFDGGSPTSDYSGGPVFDCGRVS
jgi:hypothetical protein